MSDPIDGVVIWIHPENRFYRVKFDLPGGSVVEAYQFYGDQISEEAWNLYYLKQMLI